MTDRQYVLRAAHLKGIDLIKPTRGNPGILGYAPTTTGALGSLVIDALTWSEARAQLNAAMRAY